MTEGIALVFNGRAYRLRALSVTQRPPGIPHWTVDVDGSKGMAQSLEAAILLAARGAESLRGGGLDA